MNSNEWNLKTLFIYIYIKKISVATIVLATIHWLLHSLQIIIIYIYNDYNVGINCRICVIGQHMYRISNTIMANTNSVRSLCNCSIWLFNTCTWSINSLIQLWLFIVCSVIVRLHQSLHFTIREGLYWHESRWVIYCSRAMIALQPSDWKSQYIGSRLIRFRITRGAGRSIHALRWHRSIGQVLFSRSQSCIHSEQNRWSQWVVNGSASTPAHMEQINSSLISPWNWSVSKPIGRVLKFWFCFDLLVYLFYFNSSNVCKREREREREEGIEREREKKREKEILQTSRIIIMIMKKRRKYKHAQSVRLLWTDLLLFYLILLKWFDYRWCHWHILTHEYIYIYII